MALATCYEVVADHEVQVKGWVDQGATRHSSVFAGFYRSTDKKLAKAYKNL